MSKPSPEQQQHIEQMFSRIESQISIIFRKITKAFEQQDKELWLTRYDRDLIRKFIFLLKYRGSTFHQRFYHDNAEGFDTNDRELLHDYMAEKGYKRPVDVWFNNLKTDYRTSVTLKPLYAYARSTLSSPPVFKLHSILPT
jgi:hypothetical protein